MELVSIITPLYNSENFLTKTVNSVLSQSYKRWELILIDDCSTDRSYELARSFSSLDERIKVIKLNQNSGAAVARNTGIQSSVGRYIAFLDSDDSWHAEKLIKQIAFMRANNYPFSFTAYEKITESGESLNKVGIPARVSYGDLLKTNFIGCFTAVYDTEYFGKVEMPIIRRRQDYGLWLKLLKRTKYAYGLNEILGKYCVRQNSVSSNKLTTSAFTWKLYREIEKLSLLKSVYYFSHYAIKGLIRTKLPKIAKLFGFMKSEKR